MESGTELAGRYRLESLLGRGGMGEVWRCRDLRLDREVAVKVLLAAVPDPDEARQFRRDAQSAAGLRHPGITAVFDVDQHDGRMFIAMELLHGQDLARLLSGHSGGLPVSQALSIGIEIAAALAYAHGEGIVHRDLKPRTSSSRTTARVKVCDFGIARDLNGTSPHRTGQLLGTPAYIAPEQWAGEPVTHSADLYALGCTLYELLTGQLPFQGSSLAALIHRHLTEVPVPPLDRRPQVPAALSDLVVALLAKAPEDRPPDAPAVVAALTKIRDTGNQVLPRKVPVPSGTLLACTSSTVGAIDVHAVDSSGRIRRCAGAASESAVLWHGWGDLSPRTGGKVTALASGSSGRGVYITAVIDGIPCMNEGLTEWRELLETCPLRLPVVDVAVPSALRGAVTSDSVAAYVLDADGVIWSSRATAPLNTPAIGRFNVIAACHVGQDRLGPARRDR